MATDHLDTDELDQELAGLDPIERLTVKTGRLTKAIKGERDARRRGNRIMAVAITVVLLFSGLLWKAIDEIRSARTEGRVLSCNQLNTLIDPLNDIIAGFAAPRPDRAARTPEEQAALNMQVSQILLRRRVCTPEGIAAFYRNDLDHAYEDPPQAKALEPTEADG